MTSGSTTSAGPGVRGGPSRSTRPDPNRPPRGALALVAMVALASAGCVGLSLTTLHWRSEDLIRSGLIIVLAVLYLESSLRMARMQRYLQTPARVSMVSVWVVAAALCVPLAYVSVLVPLLLLYEARASNAYRQSRHRVILTTCASTLAGLGGRLAFNSLRPDSVTRYGGRQALAVLVGVCAFVAVNALFALLLSYLQAETVRLRGVLPNREEQALQLATLVLGVIAAQLLISVTFLAPIVLVLMGLLQRSAMVSQLQVAATTDAKTGLLNAAAWQELAQRELLRAERDHLPGAVMLLDLDHFKRLNDTLGHLRGDVALKAVADALKRELRGYDAVARFGGEEFVVFLNDLSIEAAAVVAERVLTRIRNLTITAGDPNGERYLLTASIGLASLPEHGNTLIELLEAADLALYSAKNDGRDRVRQPHQARTAESASAGEQRPAERDVVRPRSREAS